MKTLTTIFLALFLIMSSSHILAQEHDWANFKRYEEQNKMVSTPSHVVFLGNSITEFWNRVDPNFFTKNNFINRGIGGQTTSEMLARFRPDVINLKPRVAVILAGTNDLARNNGYISLENILNNIISMTELAKHNGIKVILCSVPPANQFPWREYLQPAEDVVALNAMIKKYATENNIIYVDYYSALADDKGGIPKKYSKDGVHPNLEAYKVMEEIILKAINSIEY